MINVMDMAQLVEVDGVLFTEEALKELVHLAEEHKTISVLRVGNKLYFTEVPIKDLREGEHAQEF